jgi:two-component system OmpR family sensor kinase
MPMGRLFWKFLFSYWAALVLGVLSVEGALWLYRQAETDRTPTVDTGPLARIAVGTAAVVLHDGGLPALQHLAAEWRRHGIVPPFAVDASGRDFEQRATPPAALAQAETLAAQDGGSDSARRVRLVDGSTYLLFIPVAKNRHYRPSLWEPFSASVLASLIFGSLLAWYVSRPLRHLRDAFSSLASGQLDTRVAPLIGRRRDEVADLGRDFDLMAHRLQALIASQRTLLHDVSHELRSPLARLQAAIGLARQSPEKLGATLERIEAEATRLDELVGELLTLARLEAGIEAGASEPLQEIDLMDLVAAVASDTRFEAEAAGRRVVFAGEGEVLSDVRPALLHRAIENVARNAVKFTAEGSTVKINAAATLAGDAFHVTIADRGPGVPEAEMESIFEPFYRGADRHTVAGFGLGLAIARRAVEAHGGTIRAQNRSGGGLEVEIVLPLTRSAR